MRYDLIIVGGGLVGAGLACALRESGLTIALIDAKLPHADDPRLFALNNSSCQFLTNVNVWQQLEKHASAIHQVHVSHRGHFGSVRLNKEDVQLSSLGHVIPAYHIEAALNDMLLTLPNITIYRPAKLKHITQNESYATLTIETAEGEQQLTTSIVIGADGTESTVRTQLNIPIKAIDYQQSAIVTRTTLQRSHRHIAYERFNEHGAVAMLPLINNESATIWTADNITIQQLNQLSDDAFLNELQNEFGYRLGRLQQIAKRHVFPLRMVRAEKMVEGHVFLLGNSAHTLSPIAAQGFNLALYEVATLVDGIMQKVKQHESISVLDLMRINEKTESQKAASIGLSHRLTTLFSKESAIHSILLQLGMIGLEVATPIKRKFITSMIGKRGNVPRFLLGQ